MKRRWVNTRLVTDIVTGRILKREGYWYTGPWTLAHNEFVADFNAFRFYDDGTESGSSPKAAQDTDLGAEDVDSDVQLHLRARIEEVGGGSVGGAATDDYDLQYQLNGGGSWILIIPTSDRVIMDTGSLLTDADPTTNRGTDGITDGAGSFVASEQCEANSEITDFELTADNFTEAVWALKLISADFVNADFVEFRIRLNGGNPGMTNTSIPRITVTKTAVGGGRLLLIHPPRMGGEL